MNDLDSRTNLYHALQSVRNHKRIKQVLSILKSERSKKEKIKSVAKEVGHLVRQNPDAIVSIETYDRMNEDEYLDSLEKLCTSILSGHIPTENGQYKSIEFPNYVYKYRKKENEEITWGSLDWYNITTDGHSYDLSLLSSFVLKNRIECIGRRDDNSVSIPNSENTRTISRNHMYIVRLKDENGKDCVVLMDNGSLNGTSVNGTAVKDTCVYLHDDDYIYTTNEGVNMKDGQSVNVVDDGEERTSVSYERGSRDINYKSALLKQIPKNTYVFKISIMKSVLDMREPTTDVITMPKKHIEKEFIEQNPEIYKRKRSPEQDMPAKKTKT